MSKYRVHKSQVRSAAAICEAIADHVARLNRLPLNEARALVEQAVEIHDQPVNLIGYQGDTREQTANVVCRRDFVNRYMGGGLSNDAGWLVGNDTAYEAVISDYDNKWWASAAPRFWQVAMAQEAIQAAEANGYILHRSEEENGNIKLVAEMVASGGSGW
jgi:hypothetical protein